MTLPDKNNLAAELWTSWASCLRSYLAAHGLTSTHHAVVEVGEASIILRVDTRWVCFTHDTVDWNDGSIGSFALNDDGTVRLAGKTEEMDLAAEQVARRILTDKVPEPDILPE